MRLYFDLEPLGPDDARRYTERLAAWFSAAVDIHRAEDADSADMIISMVRTRAWRDTHGPGWEEHFPQKTYAWDCDDFPSGRLPGLYAALPRGLFEPSRHRSFCYAFRWNDEIRALPADGAEVLFGFRGSISSPLRGRLADRFSTHADARIEITGSLWGRMDSPSAVTEKRAYAEHLRHCRFILCPRGNGVSSVRLFEVLESGRVPVVLSDAYVPPPIHGWEEFSVTIPEDRLCDIPSILRERADDWAAMAARARHAWQSHFSESALLHTLCRLLADIGPARGPGPRHHLAWGAFRSRQAVKDARRLGQAAWKSRTRAEKTA